MRFPKLIIILGFFTLVILAFAWKFSRERTQQKLFERSLSDQALSYFNASLQDLTAAQIAAQHDAIGIHRAELAEKMAKVNARTALIPFFSRLNQAATIAYLGTGCFSLLVGASGMTFAYVRKKSVYVARVNGNEIPVKHADLTALMPVLAGSVQAQIQAALKLNDEEAQQRARNIMSDMAILFRSIGGRHGIATQIPITPIPDQAALLPAPSPAFAQASELFRPGAILAGYNIDNPIYLPLTSFVSAAVGGETGSGKTSKLRFLLCQLAAQGVSLTILDAHQGHSQSLVNSLGSLTRLPNVRVFHPGDAKAAIKTMLKEAQTAIDAAAIATPPRIYVLDELRPLNRACPSLELLMDKLANEGRKYQYYGIFISQTWEAKMFEQSGSAARDACVLKLAARMPKGQARILLQDNEAARTVSHLSKAEMYIDSMDFSGVLTVPYASQSDMDMVAARCVKGDGVSKAFQGVSVGVSGGVPTAGTGVFQLSPILLRVLEEIERLGSLNRFCAAAKIETSKGSLSLMLKGTRPLSDEMARKLMEYFETNPQERG
jgi:hypothetical protein